MADVKDVAAAVIDRVQVFGIDDSLTAKKLQKLVYYSQVWYLVDFGTPLFDEPIQAWAEGPVVRSLWEAHRGAFTVRNFRFGNKDNLTARESAVIAEVVDRYGRLSADHLSELTHAEAPWKQARQGLPDDALSAVEIDQSLILESYGRGVVQPVMAVELAIADNRLEGLTTSPAAVPLLHAVARGGMSVEDAIKERLAAVLP